MAPVAVAAVAVAPVAVTPVTPVAAVAAVAVAVAAVAVAPVALCVHKESEGNSLGNLKGIYQEFIRNYLKIPWGSVVISAGIL